MIDNYRLPRKDASFRFVILHRHLWGGKFQMSVIGERLVIGGNGGIFQTEKSRYRLKSEMDSMWGDFRDPLMSDDIMP